jgi:hypothetical protein
MSKVVCLFVSLAAVVTAQAGERLSNDEMQSYYTDRTVNTVHFKLGPGKTYFGSDGSVHSKSDNGNERIGKWWVNEDTNKRCVRWNNENKDFCHYTEKNPDGTHTLVHGKNGKKIVEMKSTQQGNQL